MKGFAPLGHGGPFSSSNLSPLAPPFTVDSCFPRPQVSNNPLGYLPEHHLYESDHIGGGDASWFPGPGYSPTSPGFYVSNNGPTPPFPFPSLSIQDSATSLTENEGSSFFRGPRYSPTFPRYFPSSTGAYISSGLPPSPSVQDSGTSLAANECDFFPEPRYSHTAPAGGMWNGAGWTGMEPTPSICSVNNIGASVKSSTSKDVNLVPPPSYASLVTQGVSAADGLPACDEPSNVWVGKSVDSLGGKRYVGSRCTNLPVGKLASASGEKSRDAPFDMSRTPVLNPVSPQDVPYHRAPSPDFMMDSWSQFNPSIDSYNRCFTGFDSYKNDSLCFYPASSSSSMDKIYESPSINGNSSTPLNRTMSANMNPIERPKDICDRKEASASHGNSNPGCFQFNAKSSKIYGDTSSINDAVEKNYHSHADPSRLKNIVSLQPNPVIVVDPSKHLFKQCTDFDLPSTLVTAEAGAGDFFECASEVPECASEVLEQFNPGVDSPCWKGALDSRFSLFGATEAGTPHIPAKISEGCNNINLQGPQNHPVNSDMDVAFSSLELQRKEKCSGEDGSSSILKQPSPALTLPAGNNCQDILKVVSDHLEVSNENVIPSKADGGTDLGPSQNICLTYQQLVSEGRITGWVPYHASDQYSSLSSSRGNVPTNLTEPLLGPVNTFPGRQHSGVHVQSVVNSMQNLSELLLSYCSEGEDALKEQEHVVIQQVVQNLNTCLLRGCTVKSMSKTQLLLEPTNCSGKQSNDHKGTTTNPEVKDVQSRCNTQNCCEGNKNFTIFSTKEDNSPPLAFQSGDPELEQDDMTKGIKKILEENLHDEEERERDVQSLLYKNLWLEAEAALCSIKYKARFARMKIEMEKHKKHTGKGEPIDVEKLPSSNTSEVNMDNHAETKSKESVDSDVSGVLMLYPNQSSTVNHTEDVNASVMARFHILKSRLSSTNKEGKQRDSINGGAHAGIEETFSNPSNGNAEDIVMKPQQPRVVNLGFAERRNPWPFIRDNSEVNNISASDYIVNPHSNSDESEHQDLGYGAMQSATINLLVDRLSAGECGSPSSDWEHVLKDATWPS